MNHLMLEQSKVRRPNSRWQYASERHEIAIGLWVPNGLPDQRHASLSFNMGDKQRTEQIQVCVHPHDFVSIAATMIAADREATIEAFALAIVASSEKSQTKK